MCRGGGAKGNASGEPYANRKAGLSTDSFAPE